MQQHPSGYTYTILTPQNIPFKTRLCGLQFFLHNYPGSYPNKKNKESAKPFHEYNIIINGFLGKEVTLERFGELKICQKIKRFENLSKLN